MSSPASRRARTLESVYRAWGEPAGWISVNGDVITGIRVRRIAQEEDVVDYGGNSRAVVERIVLRVRVSEVSTARKGDRIEIMDDAGEVIGAYQVADRPLRARMGQEWRVEVEVADHGNGR